VGVWRQLRAILLLPFTVTVVVPLFALWNTEVDVDLVPALVGGVSIALGLALVTWTVALFRTVGRGTLAPWDATRKLVVRGPYRHVRNPMITGVALILAGEAVTFRSWGIVILLAVFAAANAIYMPLAEEPGLRRRFGDDYDAYREHVPRWLPQLDPWEPAERDGGSQGLPRRRPPGAR
jgi:protein-S-isoprenylcysteine O-methyltransferase Ste14